MSGTSGEIHARIDDLAEDETVDSGVLAGLISGPLNRALRDKARLLGRDAYIDEDRFGEEVPVLNLYGCGYFGCVYRAKDPDLVVKFTTDESEAQISDYLAAKQYRAGIVRFYQVFEIPGRFEFIRRPRKMFVIWRENATVAGMLGSPRRSAKEGDPFPQKSQKILAKMFLRELPLFSGSVGPEEFNAAFIEFLDAIYLHYRTAAAFRPVIQDALKDFKRAGKKIDAPDLELSDLESLEYRAALVLTGIYELRESVLGRDIGLFLGNMLFDEGVLLTDVHPGNVGVVPRRELPVIVDPGLVWSVRRTSRSTRSKYESLSKGPEKLPFYRELPSIFE